MTKNFRYIVSLAVMTIAFSAAAFAQLPSLANVGDDVYTSSADGFEIAVPHECVKVAAATDERTYTCNLTEGMIRISVNSNTPGIKSDGDISMFLKGFKEGLLEETGVKFFGETAAKVGDYRGAAYQITIDGDKTLMIALAWSKFAVVITGRANSNVPNSAELISSAVQSFSFVSPTSK